MRYRITRGTTVIGHGIGGPSTGLLNTFLGDSEGVAMVALGVAVLVVGALAVFSTTEAGRLTGQATMSAARRGLRLIPGAGALV